MLSPTNHLNNLGLVKCIEFNQFGKNKTFNRKLTAQNKGNWSFSLICNYSK